MLDDRTVRAGGAIATTVSTTDGGRGWFGRVGAGCDYQFPFAGGQWVVGAFGDDDFMDAPRNNTPSELFAFPGGGFSPITSRTMMTDAYYADARIGYVALCPRAACPGLFRARLLPRTTARRQVLSP